jgi:peptidoglycan/LPS O-acetylase OafA/YrhL
VLDRKAVDSRFLARVALPVGLACVAVSLVVRSFSFDQTLRYTLQSFGLAPFFSAAIVWHDRWPFRWLNTAVMRYLGTLSYSMYLLHTATLWMFERWAPWPEAVRSVVALAALVALGAAIYRFVEKPCARIRRHLARYLEPTGTKAPARA